MKTLNLRDFRTVNKKTELTLPRASLYTSRLSLNLASFENATFAFGKFFEVSYDATSKEVVLSNFSSKASKNSYSFSINRIQAVLSARYALSCVPNLNTNWKGRLGFRVDQEKQEIRLLIPDQAFNPVPPKQS